MITEASASKDAFEKIGWPNVIGSFQTPPLRELLFNNQKKGTTHLPAFLSEMLPSFRPYQ